MRNILLINTPSEPLGFEKNILPVHKQNRVSVNPPMGLCYLSSFLSAKEYYVEILDLEVEIFYLLKTQGRCDLEKVKQLVSDKMKNLMPDVVGISCLVSTRYKQAHKLCEIVKSINKDALTVMGGNYPTNSPQFALQDKNLDFVVLGEGEVLFWNLLKAIDKGQGLDSLNGIGYRAENKVKINQRTCADFITDLDSLPFPDYNKVPIEKYYQIERSQSPEGNFRFFTIFTSRGCPRQCIYCAARNTFGSRYRARSAENVLAEIDWLKQNFGMQEIHFQDDNLAFDRKRAEAIFDGLIKRGGKIPWTTPNGLDSWTIDEELLKKMKASGGKNLAVAVESGSPRVLKMVRKNIDLDRMKKIVAVMKNLGIYTKAFFMLGFPGETKQEMQDTVNYAADLGADWSSFNIANPLPGTLMAEIAAQKGYLISDKLDNIEYSSANIETEEFSKEYVEKLENDANIRVNFLNNPNLKNGNIDWAIKDFKRIAQRYPGHMIAHYCLAKSLIKKGLTQQGLVKLEKLRGWQENNNGKPDLLKKYNIDIKNEIAKLHKG